MSVGPTIPGTVGYVLGGYFGKCPNVNCTALDEMPWEHEDQAEQHLREHVDSAHPGLLLKRAELQGQLARRGKDCHEVALGMVMQAMETGDYTGAHLVLDAYNEIVFRGVSAYA